MPSPSSRSKVGFTQLAAGVGAIDTDRGGADRGVGWEKKGRRRRRRKRKRGKTRGKTGHRATSRLAPLAGDVNYKGRRAEGRRKGRGGNETIYRAFDFVL
mmetsp:Transcript_22788/g.34329  ORF Transcript_22788/g.34329 Transcript_22788/m.34329 type:complete len:100 (-) Transcript_22788:201-500(-)